MEHDLPLVCFFFVGGDKDLIRHGCAAEDPDVRAAVAKLLECVKQPYPALIPNVTQQYCRAMTELEEAGGVLWSDCPLDIKNLRLFTVCFRAKSSRAYWNVLSFAYDATPDAVATMRTLMGRNARAWTTLIPHIGDGMRTLAPERGESCLPAAQELAARWNAKGTWCFNFPRGNDGGLVSGKRTFLPGTNQEKAFRITSAIGAAIIITGAAAGATYYLARTSTPTEATLPDAVEVEKPQTLPPPPMEKNESVTPDESDGQKDKTMPKPSMEEVTVPPSAAEEGQPEGLAAAISNPE